MVKLILFISATLFVLSNCDLIGFNRFSNRVQSHLHHIKAAFVTDNRHEIQIYKWILKQKKFLTPEMKRWISKPSASRCLAISRKMTNIITVGQTSRLSRYKQNI